MTSPPTTPSGAGRSVGVVLASNTGWRLLAFGARSLGGLVVTVLLAHLEGPAGLGRFQFALTLTLLLSFAVAFGLPKLLVRELARRPDQIEDVVATATTTALIAGTVVTLLMFSVGQLLGADTTVLVLAGLALTMDSAMRINMTPFWALEKMRYEALAVGVQEAVFLALAAGALIVGAGAVGVMAAYLVSRIVGFGIAWLIVATRFGVVIVPRWRAGSFAPLLRKSTPFALDDALSLAYIRLDTILLGIIVGAHAVGLYQSATNLVLYLNILPRMLNLSMYPRMSRAWPGQVAELRRLLDSSLLILGAIAVPITVGSLLLAPRIFAVMYGSRFESAVLAYQLLVPIIPMRMLGNSLGTALTAADRQTQRTVAVGVAAVVNVSLNLALIPRWSFFGAVVATLVTETGLFVAYAVMLRRVAGATCLPMAIGVPGLACLPLAGAVVVFADAPLALVIGIAGLAYVVALYA
ncbi:MAG TPA: flippase, partial [Actinomycetota bacterium]|nr:flippase [Actinomycetota bacterium]